MNLEEFKKHTACIAHLPRIAAELKSMGRISDELLLLSLADSIKELEQDYITEFAMQAVKKIIKHRSALVIAGIKLGVPEERLMRHDDSKLSEEEFSMYVERFEMGLDKPEHAAAWMHHWKSNDHHIEYWLDKSESGKAEIPTMAIKEMVADWMAASYAYEGKWPRAGEWEWADKNLSGIVDKMEYGTKRMMLYTLMNSELITKEIAVNLGLPLGITDKSHPPAFVNVNYFERSDDPRHAEAFPDELKPSAPNQNERKSGWMGIDWIENPIGFIPDGTECELADDFEIKESYGPYNKRCAVARSNVSS